MAGVGRAEPMIGRHTPLGSLSHRERDGVRGFDVSTMHGGNPLTPALSPNGERESCRVSCAIVAHLHQSTC
jgi:hypothetical protein